MKIGILTFHQSVNNGAVMQAYSLSKRLKKEYPNALVEIIDYRKKSVDEVYAFRFRDYIKSTSLTQFIKKSILLALHPNALRRKRKRTRVFWDCQNKLPLSERRICSDGTEELDLYIQEHYDVLIVGSDAVWNYVTRGFPNAYFPSPALNVKKMSYAASCYGMDFLNSTDAHKGSIKSVLDAFDFIGVRDTATEDFVKWSGCTATAHHTCDPTVFLDVNDLPVDENTIKEKLKKRGFDFSKPTIGIMGSVKMLKMVRSMFGKNYQLVALYDYLPGADVNLYDLEPYEWAYVFRLFKLTFTTYFHGTLLSLRNGTPLICISLPTEFSKRHTPKTLDVLTRLGYQDWYFSTDYKSANFDCIKQKAQELLKADLHDEIIRAMDKEAQTFDVFNENLKNILESKND